MLPRMRFARAITVLAAGAATAWFLERRQLLPRQRRPELAWPPDPIPQPAEPGVEPAEPEPADVEPEPDDVEPEPDDVEPEPDDVEPEPADPEPEPADPEPEEPSASFVAPSEQPTREQPALEREPEPVDVTSLVDDLIAPTSVRGRGRYSTPRWWRTSSRGRSTTSGSPRRCATCSPSRRTSPTTPWASR